VTPHPSSADVSALYERHAATWDSERGKQLFERGWLDRFRSLLSEGASVLDLGCGSGEPMAQYLSESGYAVTGVDSSAAMIGLCRARLPRATWVVADMRSVHLAQRFAGIMAWDSFFHLTQDDQRSMFAVFEAHVEPGGALMFTSGPAAGEAIGAYRGDPLYHASLGSTEYRTLLDSHGFKVVRHVVEDPDCGGHTDWLAQALSR
jgi:cyclopropane fatty-acyl-phospholipid synthase-like methyltransferase